MAENHTEIMGTLDWARYVFDCVPEMTLEAEQMAPLEMTVL